MKIARGGRAIALSSCGRRAATGRRGRGLEGSGFRSGRGNFVGVVYQRHRRFRVRWETRNDGARAGTMVIFRAVTAAGRSSAGRKGVNGDVEVADNVRWC
jgi:hypothetical protein